ncbi:MAG: EamA family transporter [Gaiellaceae bacterium]
MIAILLALGSSLTWGAADFAGGFASRRLPVATVAFLSQAAGFVVLIAFAAGSGAPLHRDGLLLGLAAGAGGGIGLAAFYAALARGTMSVVSPIAACGAVVPLGLALAGGERPNALALGGAVLALGGAILASVEERRATESDRRSAVLLALLAAVALGCFVYFLGLGSQHGGSLSALLGARIGSFTLLGILVIRLRSPLRAAPLQLAAVAAIGIVDVSANALFALASERGLLAIVSVLGSLYPIATVLLAHVVLGERLTRTQRGGVVVALVGVALVSA